MKNVEFGEAFGLEEAAGVAGVSERNLLRMAGKGEVSVWFWCRGSEFFDQNDTIIWLDGWLRVPAGTTRLFTEYEAVRVTVFENQDGDCYYPTVNTNPVSAVVVVDHHTPRYFGQSEAVPMTPTFEKGYWTLEKRGLFFVPSEIEAIAVSEKQWVAHNGTFTSSTGPIMPSTAFELKGGDRLLYREIIATFLNLFKGKNQRGGYKQKLLNQEVLGFQGKPFYEDSPSRRINEFFSKSNKARTGNIQEFQQLQEEEQCYLLIIGEILNFLCNETGNNMEIQGVDGIVDKLFSHHEVLDKKMVTKTLTDIQTQFSC